MATPLVVRHDRADVTTLTLNRPEKLNALIPEMFVELRKHVDNLASDAEVACVVLTGAGRSFSVGHDLAAIAAGDHVPVEFEAATVDALEALPCPTLAKIRGHCFTGGLELALACDLLVAGRGTLLGDTHGQWGAVPVWGMSVRLPERVGPSRAKELMFTSRRIDAASAAEIGLLDRCVDDGDLDAAVGELVAEIAANSRGTNRIDKALLASNREMPRQQALLRERTNPFGMPKDLKQRVGRRWGA